MAMIGILGWLVVGFYILPMVRGGYNCSKSLILEEKVDNFKETMKQACSNLKVYLYLQEDMKMNLSAKSEKTGLSIWMWGECDKDQSKDVCRDCINDLTDNLFSVCNNSSWGELSMTTHGKIVCYIHYNGIEYIDDGPPTLIEKFRLSLLFFLLWHLFMFLYMCLM